MSLPLEVYGRSGQGLVFGYMKLLQVEGRFELDRQSWSWYQMKLGTRVELFPISSFSWYQDSVFPTCSMTQRADGKGQDGMGATYRGCGGEVGGLGSLSSLLANWRQGRAQGRDVVRGEAAVQLAAGIGGRGGGQLGAD